MHLLCFISYLDIRYHVEDDLFKGPTLLRFVGNVQIDGAVSERLDDVSVDWSGCYLIFRAFLPIIFPVKSDFLPENQK